MSKLKSDFDYLLTAIGKKPGDVARHAALADYLQEHPDQIVTAIPRLLWLFESFPVSTLRKKVGIEFVRPDEPRAERAQMAEIMRKLNALMQDAEANRREIERLTPVGGAQPRCP